jgi:hypothetical protein
VQSPRDLDACRETGREGGRSEVTPPHVVSIRPRSKTQSTPVTLAKRSEVL